MKQALIILTLIALTGLTCGRPVAIPTTAQLINSSPIVAIIKPISTRQTSDLPDDDSFGNRDMTNYRAFETTCKVEGVFKGEVKTETLKIVHFVYASDKPEFNGGLMMTFLFDPTVVLSYPSLPDRKPDLSYSPGYGNGFPEYLAFLRWLPDGRYAAAAPHYDAATAFRLLSKVEQAQRFHHHLERTKGE